MSSYNKEQGELRMPDGGEKCASEPDRIEALLRGLPEWASLATQQPEPFWDRQRLLVQRQIAEMPERKPRLARLAWAAAFVLILIATFVLRTGSRIPVAPTSFASDRDLLVQVEQALDGDVPQALQPASLIANEIDQAAQPRSHSTSLKEKSEHEN